MIEIEKLFLENYGQSNGKVYSFFSPGRVNLIGEHIDYSGGLVFPAALTIGIYGAARYRDDNLIRMRSKNISGEVIINLEETLEYNDEDNWGNYPKGIIKELINRGHKIKGMDLLFYSNLPDGAGLSSSAALEVLTGYIILSLENGNNVDRIELSKLCQNVENKFIGVSCGIMDQFSVSLGKKDNAILLDCNSLYYEYVPLDLGNSSLVIMNTNKRRELSDSKYNERRSECEKALELININKANKLKNLCEASLEDVEHFISDTTIKKRSTHVITENKRVKMAACALRMGDIERFGKLMIESHKSLKEDYEVTGFYLDTIVSEALKIKGCIGSRMTGAGFGGCAIALVDNSILDEFENTVSKEYEKITGIKPEFYVSSIGDGVFQINH
ncbi:MAG: galactokinase [Bacillota bacterium]|nr:galactokinase [Bacillota bacterium]